ncbi:MAG: STAS domain-containing protein [Pseudomonadota bacterium]
MTTVHAVGGRIEVAGDLLFADAVPARDAGRALVQAAAGPEVVVSLAGLGRINSVAAVVLLDWQRTARAAGRRLRVTDVPPQLAGILRLSGLDEVLAGGAPATP